MVGMRVGEVPVIMRMLMIVCVIMAIMMVAVRMRRRAIVKDGLLGVFPLPWGQGVAGGDG